MFLQSLIVLSILFVSIGVWVDHMVDHFSTYLYQKRGFNYFSRRVPKELHHCHAKHRIVLALNTRSRAKAFGGCPSDVPSETV